MTGQTLEWLQLLGAAAARQRTQDLLENATAARAGQVTADGWKEFTGSLKNVLKK